MGYFALELSVGAFERTGRFGKRGEGARQGMLGVVRRFSRNGKNRGHEDPIATAVPARHKLP
jgi:hypothetical protein